MKLVLAVVFLVFAFFIPAGSDGEVQLTLYFYFRSYLIAFHPLLIPFVLFLLLCLLVIIKNILLLVGVLKDKDEVALTKANKFTSLIFPFILYAGISALFGFFFTFHAYAALAIVIVYTIIKKILDKKLNIEIKKK